MDKLSNFNRIPVNIETRTADFSKLKVTLTTNDSPSAEVFKPSGDDAGEASAGPMSAEQSLRLGSQTLPNRRYPDLLNQKILKQLTEKPTAEDREQKAAALAKLLDTSKIDVYPSTPNAGLMHVKSLNVGGKEWLTP